MRDIVVAKGDGVGPEIMEAVLTILESAGAELNFEFITIGESIYQQGVASGITKEAWETIKKHKVLLKAPITTPQGKGYKSLNVTFRKSLGLFANVRPLQSLQPILNNGHPKMDMVIIRENEEDLYAGIEYRSSPNSYLSFKLVSRAGCEKIVRYAFEYARSNNRKKVTCVIKDNIMKITDGFFHNTFKEIAREYQEIESNSYIVDIGAARIATKPQLFDVVVTLNLYGDILSDIAAEVSGSIGLAGSANIGLTYSMFEAVHGSAPDIAGQNIANPSGLLNSAIMMLNHIGKYDIAAKIKNAWLKTIEDGYCTPDIYNERSFKKLSTQEFTKEIIHNLGQLPKQLPVSFAKAVAPINIKVSDEPETQQIAVGIDIYLLDNDQTAPQIAQLLAHISKDLELKSIAQRGLLVWPNSESEEITTDMMRLRFIKKEHSKISTKTILELLSNLHDQSLDVTATQMLYQYDGFDGFSKTQGE